MRWQEFSQKPLEERIHFYQKDQEIYNILFAQQLSVDFLESIYILTNKIRLISKTTQGKLFLKSLLATKRVMLYFLQPSTRTFLSFLSACQNLGMDIMEVRSQKISSEFKGENFDDTIRTFSSYCDLIIMRHEEKGFAERASFLLNTKAKRSVPLINAGSGKDEHPTQAMLDIFTLEKSFSKTGGLEKKTIMFVGDLKRGRTVKSLCCLLKKYKEIQFIFSSPKSFSIEEPTKNDLKKDNIQFLETEKFEEYIPEADAIYMTRLQDEYDDKNLHSTSYDKDKYVFKQEHLKKLKHSSVILHPLPRRNEIEPAVDNDWRAMYWRQVRNGMWVRTALIAKLLKVNKTILEY